MYFFEVAQERVCSYQLLDNNIHEFIFHQGTTTAIDAWVEHLYEIQASAHEEETLLMLMDTSVGAVPLSYAAERLKVYYADYPDRARSMLAVLQTDSAMSSLRRLVDHTPTRLGGSREQIRLFAAHEREDAIAWLLAHE
jgi:hypothetical protein